MELSPALRNQLSERLSRLYPERTDEALRSVATVVEKHLAASDGEPLSRPRWSERDVVLISYGDQVRCPEGTPLSCLREFLTDCDLTHSINNVHLLPFFPYSSDDGFSVIDYRTVDPELGDWNDIHALGDQVQLAFDLVLNHVSSQSEWFQAYLRGESPYVDYFVEADPEDDLSQVVRPRSLPLLTPYDTSRGRRWVWTTFSEDQIDLNYANPRVLTEMLDVLLEYVRHGARIVRLDAIAYLWKETGTSCIHLPQTHEVVKLFRDVFDAVAPGTLLLTETNVPHAENVSYFGSGDEAHLVYQFSLPPLLLDALQNDDARWLAKWLSGLGTTPPGTSFFNFTASHDGIGVRPLEGLVPPQRVTALAERVRELGGHVSTRRQADGTDSPYELNITYFDALGGPGMDEPTQIARFLASQAIMLSLRGIPGIYFHSLTASHNDLSGVEQTGRARSINRHKFERGELDQLLADTTSAHRQVFDRYREMLTIRAAQPAFHPEAEQEPLPLENDQLLALRRTSLDGQQTITVVANCSRGERSIALVDLGVEAPLRDLLTAADVDKTVHLGAYQVIWLTQP